jgi:hypothetical protein
MFIEHSSFKTQLSLNKSPKSESFIHHQNALPKRLHDF